MAEALLGIVIENLGSIIQDELATFWGVDQQTDKLSKDLNAIRAVLKDAERKQITNGTVKNWLQELTDAAYVLDDVLDDCSIHSKTVQSRAQNSFLARLHPKDILFRRHIGKRMKDITQKFHDIHERRCKFASPTAVTENQPQEYDEDWRQTSSVVTEPVIYGRDQDREKIVQFLLGHASNIQDLSIYPIVGMGGLGKTTIAKQVFNDDEVKNHFDLRIWVCVSDDFNMRTILQSIIECTTGQNPNLGALEAMQKKVEEVLQSKSYLLVLDDVWNEDQEKWNKLKGVLQSTRGTKGSTVLVTTRIEDVASIMETQPAHRLMELSEDESWSLFKHHAFGPNREASAELVAIGKDIVRKCVGSPLAIKTLGTLLHDESQVQQWENIKGSEIWDIKEEGSITSEENAIMRALKLSYVNLELSLRRCFSFCAIFPKDYEIVKEELIHLWMANGFIESKGSLEVEYVGEKVWEKLYHRSFFQEAKADVFGIITSFKMHDLFHDLAQFVMGEECVIYENTRSSNLSRRVHHLNLRFSEAVNVAAFKKVESLRTLLGSSSLPTNSSLRALESNTSQLSTVMSFAHLKYLNLFRSEATSLPNSICGLQKLQILKLEYCEFLHCLPKDLTRLQDLRHLVIKGCYSIAEMPFNIGKLSHLRTLTTFVVGSKPGYGLADLHGLNPGGKLHIRGLENVPSELDAKQANLISKKELNRLYLSWGGSNNSQGSNVNAERVLEALEPPSSLKSFGMRRYQGIQLPGWMRKPLVLKDLVEVILYKCENCGQLPPLGKLPHLRRLYIYEMKDVKYINDESYDSVEEKAFPSLEKFTVKRLPKLERVLRDEVVDMLPCLTELIIDGIPNLKLPRLPYVEHLQAKGIWDGASFMEEVVGNMHCLKTLKISYFEKLKVIPDQLSRLGALQELYISSCNELECFSEDALQGLTSLRSLQISYCKKLKSLSEGVGQLACLERFDVNNCPELVALPNNMNQLTALQKVTIRGSALLPEGLQHIPSLQTLYIYLCKSTSLPDWLGDMTSLQRLDIVSCTELRSLPSNIQRLTNLRELSIRYCPVVDLPNNMNQLIALQKVSISGSALLQEGLQHIPSLQTLSIADCESTSLPDWLGDMTSLQQLDIWECRELRSLPSNIQRLTNLRELSIEDCPMLEKRCKKETGEDWQYIAHIPQLNMPLTKDTFSDKIKWTFKKLQICSTKKFATLLAKNVLPRRIWGDEFDFMVEDMFSR